MQKIPLSYFQHHDVVALSRSLIGKYLFTRLGAEKQLTGGMIIETEAYRGAEDKACHAYGNRRTKRTETMYAPGGTAYVYLCYGMHHLFNIVTNTVDIPHAILIRAIRPEMGIDLMLQRRNKNAMNPTLTSGPGTVCQALGINLSHDGVILNGKEIWLEDRGVAIPENHIQATPRIGVGYAEEDALLPWRFVYNP
jgi:DNA-3-methyladenine glycosylase